jgi:hypothetical protein
VNGAIVWSLKDFHAKPRYAGGNPKPRPPLSEKGLVDMNGVRKPAFAAVKGLFAGETN